jgi:hypothetical protein
VELKNPLILKTLVIILIIFLGYQHPTSNAQILSLSTESQPVIDYEVLFANSTVIIGNMERDTIWERVSLLEVPELGYFGSIQLYYDQRYLNGLITFEKEMPWVAVQIVNSSNAECMENSSDGWIFGESVLSEQGISYAGDAWYEGHKVPHNDDLNDISFELITSEGQPSMIEFRRFRITNDTSGYDVDFETDSIHQLIFASTANHLGDRKVYNFLLSNNTLSPLVQSSIPRTSPHEKNVDTFVSFVFFGGIFLGLLLGTIILFDKREMLE